LYTIFLHLFNTYFYLYDSILITSIKSCGNLHRNKIPTNYKLIRQGVLKVIDELCIGGCGSLEDVYHLFLHCDFYCQIWNSIYMVGLYLGQSAHILDHLIHFVALGGYSKKLHVVLQLVWFLTVWVIWRERNIRLFQQKEDVLHHLIEKIQSFWWLKANHVNLTFNYHMWWLNPLLYLGWALYFRFLIFFGGFFAIYWRKCYLFFFPSLLFSGTPCAEKVKLLVLYNSILTS